MLTVSGGRPEVIKNRFFFVNQTSGIRWVGDNKRWRMAAISFFFAHGMVRTGSGAACRVQPAQKVGAEQLQDQPWICSVVEAGEMCGCVCAGVGARQGGVPDPSTLPSKLMQL